MDLLKYGMENRRSSSAVRRRLAETVLNMEKAGADLEESRIEKSGIELPEMDDEKMLREIRARIRTEAKGKTEPDL